jgi:hypothetical protein
MMKIYSIIPGLVSLETNINSMKDLRLSDNLSFYNLHQKEKNHFKVILGDSINIPSENFIRLGNYTITSNEIYYKQDVIRGQGFKFSYNFETRTFNFNILYKFHHIGIGDIYTMGKILTHMIEYNLAKQGLFVVLGAAVWKNNKTIILLAPQGNQKTVFVNTALTKGCSYIAENYIIIDSKNNLVYGTCPVFGHRNKQSNTALATIFKSQKISVLPSARIDEIFLTPIVKYKNINNVVYNYIETYGRYYRKNNLVRALIYYKEEAKIIDQKYELLKNYLIKKTKLTNNLSDIKLWN